MTPGLVLLAQVATPIVCAVFGWLIKRSIGSMDARLNNHQERIEHLERTIVTKEDWIRESGVARKRSEDILLAVAELKGQNQAGVQIGAAVAAAINQQRPKL